MGDLEDHTIFDMPFTKLRSREPVSTQNDLEPVNELLPPKLPLWVEFRLGPGSVPDPKGAGQRTDQDSACGVLAFSAHDQHLPL